MPKAECNIESCVMSDECNKYGQEGVDWKLGFAFILTRKMGLDFLGLRFRSEKVNRD